MSQFEHMETIEKRLWSSADNLRANSNYASNEYFLPATEGHKNAQAKRPVKKSRSRHR